MRTFGWSTVLVLMTLVLSACSPSTETNAPSANTGSTAQASTSAAPTSQTASAAPPTTQAPPSPTAVTQKTFVTPDGSLSFNYPNTWRVASLAGQEHSYAVVDGAGETQLTLLDKAPGLPTASVMSGFDTGFRASVPGIKGPAGQGTSIVVQGVYGQSPGGQAAVYALVSDGSSEPIGRSGVEIAGGGYYVIFTGMVPLLTSTVSPSEAELVASATAFANSPEFAKTAKVMTSLRLNPSRVTAVGCLGARYKYRLLIGISCEDAKAALDLVEKTGTPSGARNRETADFYCFSAGYGDKQSGQADVICRHQVTPDAISFEAWFK